MIYTRKDLKRYLMADKYAMQMTDRLPNHFHNYESSWIWSYLRALRFHEFFYNKYHSSRGPLKIFYRIGCLMFGYRHNRIGIKLGFTIPVNCFEEGLRLFHIGPVVVNAHARIGKFAQVFSCVNIGNKDAWDFVPHIGDNVRIAPGAKLFGKISIGNHCSIGANAVVNKSFPDDVTIAGVPAKIIGVNKTRIRTLSEAETWNK